MGSLGCEWLYPWSVSVVGSTCMVCFSCEWLHTWGVSGVSGCMHGEFQL